MKSIITDRTIYRGPRWIWWWRLLTLLIFVPPAIYFTVKLAEPLAKMKCKISMQMDMHLAIAAITIILYTYTLFATGWTSYLRILPFNWYIQLIGDIALIALWGYAVGTAKLTCAELCKACAAHLLKEVNVNGRDCHCEWKNKVLQHAARDLDAMTLDMDMSPLEKRKGGGGHGGGGGGGGKGGKGKGKKGGNGTTAEFGNKPEEARYIIDLIMVIVLGTLVFMYVCYIPWGKVNGQASGEVDYEEAKAEELEEMGLREKNGEDVEDQVPLKEGTYDTPDPEHGVERRGEQEDEEEKGKKVPEVRVQEVSNA